MRVASSCGSPGAQAKDWPGNGPVVGCSDGSAMICLSSTSSSAAADTVEPTETAADTDTVDPTETPAAADTVEPTEAAAAALGVPSGHRVRLLP